MQQPARTRKKREKPYQFYLKWTTEAAAQQSEKSSSNQSKLPAVLSFSVGILDGSRSGLHYDSNGTGLEGWGDRIWRRVAVSVRVNSDGGESSQEREKTHGRGREKVR
ncbi:unnamed protein product [Prunus armeniaca]